MSLRSRGPLPLVWFGSLREPSGYADEARTFLLALEDAGHEPVAREFVWTKVDAGVSGRQLATVERALQRPVPAGDHVWVQHVVPHETHSNQAAGRTVVRTMFETDGLPAEFKTRLLAADQIWVPSAFNLETFVRGGLPEHRLRVLPETLDFELFSPGVEPWPVEGTRGFTFLTNFDFTDRKGCDVLLEAWARAFDPDDDVSLVLKCLSLHGSGEAEIRERVAQLLNGRATAPLVVVTDVLPLADLPRLYAAADAFVMASRGEGWGRPYMEAMAMGLPTIGSRWSGNLAFMHDGNSFLVDGELVPVADAAQRHTPLYRGHRWFEPDVDSLVAALRTVAGGASKGETRTELLERFGPGIIAEHIAALTEDVLATPATGPICVWRGDFGSGHSLAVVNDGHVAALEHGGSRVVLREEGCAPSPETVPGVASHWPPSFEAPSEGPFVLYQPWEYGCVPQMWVDSIRDLVDEVWVPSNTVRDGFVESGVSPALVHVVPNGVDLDRFRPDGPARALPTERSTVFLFVGGTIPRKGVDILLRAYREAFTAADDACLVVKAFGGTSFYRDQTSDDLFAGFDAVDAPELIVLDEAVPFDELPALYRAADVLVQPYRGEGFCLPALEGLACGLPLIVTAGGPTDDFVSDACAWRLPASRKPVRADVFAHFGLTLTGDGYLLEPDAEALTVALRDAADPEARAARAATAREHAEAFGWEHAADIARTRLAELVDRTPIRRVAAASVPGRRAFVFLVQADWTRPETWRPALHAYIDAFTDADDVTLVFPDTDGIAAALLEPELERCDPATAPDIALARPSELAAVSLELGVDAVIHAAGALPTRARLVVHPDPAALRAAVPLLQEAA